MATSANRTHGFNVSPDTSTNLSVGLSDGAVLVGGVWKKFVAQKVVVAESATNYVEVTGNGIASSNTTGFTSGANFLYVITTNATTVTGIEDWRSNPAVGSPNAYLSASTATPLGYGTGAGGTQTQATSKATAFTLSKLSGQITLAGDILNAATIVSATWTNTLIAATDVVVINHVSGGTVGSYTFNVQCGAGTATLNIRNASAANLTETPVLQFVVLKGVNA